MWVALDILGFWAALAVIATIGWGIFVSGGVRPYWRGIRDTLAPSNVSEHGDLSEGR